MSATGRSRARGLATLAAGAALLAASCALLAAWERRPAAGDAERLYVPSGLFLREAAAGFREVTADWLWFQTVQYYGGYRQGRHGLDYFRGLVRAVNVLDPRFVEAYRFGALVLATDMGDVEGGVDLLRRGILANPRLSALPFEVGFLHYVLARDYRRAAAWFDAAAAAPDANDFTRRFAAFAHRRAGELEVSLALWRNLRATTSSPQMRELAERMIGGLEKAVAARDAVAGEGRP